MSRVALFGIGGIVALVALTGIGARQSRPPTLAAEWPLLDRYCVTCHNDVELAGDLSFAARTPDGVAADPAVWEGAIRKLKGHLMPPPGEPRPGAVRLDGFVHALEGELDAAAKAAPNPGAPVLHRLNRVEYANAIRDLIELPVDAAKLLPGDDSSGGFDNIANALSVSPALLQSYVSAAAKLSRLAVGDPLATSSITAYRAPRGWQQAAHIEGQPLGTRGGFSVTHVFPLDASYEIRVGRAGSGFGLPAVGGDEPVEITIDGARAALLAPRDRSVMLSIGAGPHTLGAAFVSQHDAQGVDDLFAVHAASVGVASVVIVGPVDATGAGDTASRRRIFVCAPADEAEEPACADEILRTLAERAYRRSVPADDPALERLRRFYTLGRAEGSFETGIQRALARVLVDPEFIFRFEREPAELPVGAVYPVSDLELASRLSFFIWSSVPDDALRETAAAGRLREPGVLEREVRRMLADEKSTALVDNFASQWLMLRQLDTVSPATNDFDGILRRSLRTETELLFASVLHEDRSVVDLIDADYTFIDERLARHYGIDHVRGSRFRRVTLPSGQRRGLLGHGSLLTVTSAPNRTSPVKRGQWVLENILGAPPPPPPAGVETNLDETAPEAGAAMTMRQRLERHRTDPSCAACHELMDGIGFTLENFDFIGRWRDAEAGAPVDARGRFIDGGAIDGPASLREALLGERELFVSTFTEKLLTYALGRTLEPTDMPAVRAIVSDAAAEDDRFSALVLGIARSVPMQMRMKAGAEGARVARSE
jgi:hypothetical protein